MPALRQEIVSFPITRQGMRDLNAIRRTTLPVSGKPAARGTGTNVGPTERALSSLGGAALVGLGLGHGSLTGIGLALLGGALVYRGMTGHCHLYAATGISTAEPAGTATHREHAYAWS